MNLPPTKVALLVESSRQYGRGLLLGIAQFARVHGTWDTRFLSDRSLEEGIPDWFEISEFDGVIIRSDNRAALEKVCEADIPVVDLRAAHSSRATVVETDDRLVSRFAVDHLLRRGYTNLGFCGYTPANFSARRLRFMQEDLEQTAHSSFSYFNTSTGDTAPAPLRVVESAGVTVEPELILWLESLPRPVGIFACNDVRAIQLLQACNKSGIKVPEEVAIIGVDNDELVCNLAVPPLTSVQNNTRQIGYRAAELLDSAIRGSGAALPELELVPPTRIIARRSTDAMLFDDQSVNAALTFIRDHACRGITVDEVVRQVPHSRVTLERKFRKFVKNSINDEIKRVRIQRIKELLSETDLKLAAIANQVGVQQAAYLSSMFKKETGMTPSQYRNENRVI